MPFLKNTLEKVNVWGMIKDCIGKDITKFSVPGNKIAKYLYIFFIIFYIFYLIYKFIYILLFLILKYFYKIYNIFIIKNYLKVNIITFYWNLKFKDLILVTKNV